MDSYSDRALRGVWRAQQFSRAMTSLLHHDPGDGHDARIQAAELDHLCSSRAAQTQFCENYVGMPMVAPVHRARHSVV
jgi:p-hydroxybenzoate 3-monooxygenase